MSVALAHRPHVQVSWLPVIVVLAILVAAALVLILDDQPSTRAPAAAPAVTLSVAGAPAWTAAEPRKSPPVARAVASGRMLAAARAESPAPPRKSSHTPWLTGGGAASSR